MSRPELHATAEHGVINAPAGVLRMGEVWHLFHQYQPDFSAKRRWGHQVSTENPYSWEVCDDVLAPDADEDGIWAGSAVATADGLGARLYYTVSKDGRTAVHTATIADLMQTLDEVDEDPLHVDPSVARGTTPVAEVVGLRSPCVIGTTMLACGELEGKLRLLLFHRAPDSAAAQPHFVLDGPIEFVGETGLCMEADKLVSPRLIELVDEVDGKTYQVFITTVEKNADPSCSECSGLTDGTTQEISGYMVGHLDGTTFTVVTPFTRLDFGHDFARPRNTNVFGAAPREKAWLFGLMNGKGRFDAAELHPEFERTGWANCLTLPREATLQGGRLFQTPAPGLRDAIAATNQACCWTGIIDTVDGTVAVDLCNPDGSVAARITHSGDRISLERAGDPHVASAPLIAADSDTLTIIVDGDTVEVFADGGVVAMASRVAFADGRCTFDVAVQGNAHIEYSAVNC